MAHDEDRPLRSRRSTAGGRRWNRIAVTLANDEVAEIRAAADRSQMAVAAWLAKTALSAARSREMPASDAVLELLRAVLATGTEARRQGNNLNQAVTQLHAAGELHPALERHLHRALDDVDEALREVNAAMRHVQDKL
jgi:hypothetical protein